MTHLGDRVAPLIDGQLPLDASERAMTHMAVCAPCTEAVDLERLTKQRLASLGAPQPGADFMQRLLALGVAEGPPPPASGGYLAGGKSPSAFASSRALPPSGSTRPPSGSTTRPPGRRSVWSESRPLSGPAIPARRSARSTRNRLVFAAAGAACLVGVGVAGSVSAAPGSQRTVVRPASDSLVRQYPSSVLLGQFVRQYGAQQEVVGATRNGR